MRLYTVGHNIAGYLPECDVWAYESAEDAKSDLLSDINYAAESEDMSFKPDDTRVSELLEAAANLETADVSEGWLTYVTLNSGSQAWWVDVVDVSDEEGAEILRVQEEGA